jgi:outer membrane biosynthesis protein TonB
MVLLYARVESDGRVSHLRALSAPSVALAQASLDAVAHWKYTPQMCGSTPVTSETTIRIVFTIGG